MSEEHLERPETASAIADEFRGLISSGRLIAGDRMPPVRQVARDTGVAVGTAARAYRQLESEGIIVTRRGGGTRVSESVHPLPADVLDAIRHLDARARSAGVAMESVIAALRAMARN